MSGGNHSVLAAIAGLGLLGLAVHAQADPLIVTDGESLVFDEAGSPVQTDGASIGNDPDLFSGPSTSGSLTVGENVEWTNTGLFYVGSHWGGSWQTVGTVEFMSGSVFNNTSTSGTDDVRIGQGGTGTVTLHEGAVWNNATDLPSSVGFHVNEGGTLNIFGQLLSGVSSAINGGQVAVQGTGAEWQVGGFGLDIEGIGGPTGQLTVTGGARVHSVDFLNVGFSAGNTGAAVIGDALDSDTSSVEAFYVEIGVFANDVVGQSHGTITVNSNGRLDADLVRLGRDGGQGDLVVNQGGRVLVGGFYGFYNTVELWEDGMIDLTGGGKVVIGSDTAPLSEPDLGTPDAFDGIDNGTLLVAHNGILKGTGTIRGDVVVTGGTINPGHSPGKLTIDGDLTLDADSVLTVEIGGAGDGEFDQFNVLGSTTFAGTLNLVFLDGFDVNAGDQLDLVVFLNTANLQGEFTSLTTEGLGANLDALVDLEQLASGQPLSIDITAVPEPGVAAMLLCGALWFKRRSRATR